MAGSLRRSYPHKSDIQGLTKSKAKPGQQKICHTPSEWCSFWEMSTKEDLKLRIEH